MSNENYEIGSQYYDNKEYEKAFEYYQLASDQGFAEAQNRLGGMYFDGKFVKRSFEKAFEYFHLAADQGSSMAQYNLGVMYHCGRYGVQSFEKAVKYYQLAADQGDTDARNALTSIVTTREYLEYALVEQLEINKNLNEEVETLKEEVETLKAENLHLKYAFGGAGYQDAKEDFAGLASTT